MPVDISVYGKPAYAAAGRADGSTVARHAFELLEVGRQALKQGQKDIQHRHAFAGELALIARTATTSVN
ncbi:hypothetical protein ACFFYR_29980 [Paraburkholderia dipogonis]|uniref:hypothetical protein n=1 Tax=Paraburkholderia dipogonis TaxID=1211383 RepID=UPI0035E68798